MRLYLLLVPRRRLLCKPLFFLLAGVVLSGCATFSKDGGLDAVRSVTQQHIKQEVVWPKSALAQKQVSAQVDALLTQPLDVESAVQIALLNNQGLQASLYALGISESEVVQAGRLPNPKFSMLYARHNGDYKIEQALTFNLFSILALPKMLEIERQNFELTKQKVALEVLRLAYQTRQAYFNAVAASQYVEYSLQVKESAEASAELADRMVKAGNWNALDQARERGFYADAMLDVLNAKKQQVSTHERLSRLLGVSIEKINLQSRLPDLPQTMEALNPLEQSAFEQRLDLLAMRQKTASLAKQLGLTKVTSVMNVLEIGPARVLEGRRGDAYKHGVDISFELPLFDSGSAKVAGAEARYMQAVNRTAQIAVNAQSEIREAHHHYVTSYVIAKQYRDEIIPLRKKILAENQLRYNGMLISPFELLADARAQVASVNSYIEKLNAFWQAETALQMTLVGNTNWLEGNQ
ncbi:MAG: TolC family protein [Methylotenera sp.]|nr:TolC family protein [Methylotenera sp.]